jgi:hypothetical protein
LPVPRPAGREPPGWAAGSWAIVTAWNPAGQRRPDADNRRAEGALLALIGDRPFRVGVNGAGEWAEPSVILSGARLQEAAVLGRHFGQAAVLFGVGRRAAVVWLWPEGMEVERWWVTRSS